MRALRRRLQDAAKLSRVNQIVIERDYAQSYVLLGIGESEALGETFVFKGGTALKKIHFGSYRFSDDLDFSAIDGPRSDDLEGAIRKAIARAEAAVRKIAPLTFTVERYEERDPHPGGQEAFIVRAQFPWQRQPMVPVKIEVTHDEPVLLASDRQSIHHGYEETIDANLRAYSLEEIGAEKLRSTQQTLAKLTARGWTRPRARDYYDLWHLVRAPEDRLSWERVSAVLPQKCGVRDVHLTSVEQVFEARLVEEVRATWERTLGPFVPELPNVETALADLQERLSALLRF
ncbi:MAG: nucleotidyl transferase AbiEii/AbiGii toxin family protein [Proteobacteria bacterium]|nr:nucleotidyl transferase AbiEii/AbiGii toxin family protein [Pseudomonadota bacterium]